MASCTDTATSSTVYPRDRASSITDRRVTPGRMVPCAGSKERERERAGRGQGREL
jgi:hypothetical protein